MQVGGASADGLVFEGPLVVYATASDVECPGDGRGGGGGGGAGSAGGRGGVCVQEMGSGIGRGAVSERARERAGG